MSARLGTGREELLNAAARALAEHGYHGMSMRELARATNRAPATLYNYVEHKEDLLYLIQRDAFDQMLARAEEELAGVSAPVERLRRFVGGHVRFFADRQYLMRVLIHEAATLPPERRAEIRERKERYFRVARGLVSGVVQGASPPGEVEVERATYCLFGMLNWTYGWYQPSRHGTPDELAAAIVHMTLSGVQGLSEGPPPPPARPRSNRARVAARPGGVR
ncbi:MAG: TetR family transcriptional regulator [Polyangiaceae bacterium]|nr:TetR family transcriptional regulator [Polyangiaceae bacterium]